jgi:BON domain
MADPTRVPNRATRDANILPDEQPIDDVNALFAEAPLETTPVEDFTSQPLTDAEDVDSEGVIFPPTDPVVTTDPHGNTRVLGGFSPTASDAPVAPSTLDNLPGDEALADAIRRELREDAATTDLAIEVVVEQGIAHLRGRVPGLEDADNAEAVAARVPGLRDVSEELEVAAL